jgi:hypothetical protein
MKRFVASRARALRVGLAFLAVGCSRREPPPPPPPPPPAQVDKDIIEAAMHQCFTVDCDRAHERAVMIAADSPLRQTDDFRAIEFRFEVNRLLRAEGEPDFAKRRFMLEQFRSDATADTSLRSIATERLARLGGGPMFEVSVNAGTDGGTDLGADGGRAAEAAEIAKLMRSKKPADYQAARALLEPKMYDGRATPDDLRALTTICKAQKDSTCLKALSTLKLH